MPIATAVDPSRVVATTAMTTIPAASQAIRKYAMPMTSTKTVPRQRSGPVISIETVMTTINAATSLVMVRDSAETIAMTRSLAFIPPRPRCAIAVTITVTA